MENIQNKKVKYFFIKGMGDLTFTENYNFLNFKRYLEPTLIFISTNNKSFKIFPNSLKLSCIIYNAGYRKYNWRF